MPDLGSYLLGAAQLAAVAAPLAYSARRLRRRLLPSWRAAPAFLVEAVLAIALLTWLAELLGTFALLYAGTLIAASVLLALALTLLPAGGAVGGPNPEEALATAGVGGSPAATGPAGQERSRTVAEPRDRLWRWAVMIGVIAVVVFEWGVTTKHALDRGIFNFDSLWYHQPFAAEILQSHSTAGMHHVETVFTNWFYPQSSELLHAVGMALTGRDTLSLFLNFGWLALALLAAYCVGRPYGRGPLAVAAAAIVLDAHTLVVREPGAAKNDLMAAALLLAAIAILLTAWNDHRPDRDPAVPFAPDPSQRNRTTEGPDPAVPFARGSSLRNRTIGGWPLAAAGLAAGLAAGTKVTVLAMAAALSVAVLVLAPAGRRWAAAGWWFVPALLGGGYWYLRNLVVAGNPLPEIEKLGPISLPHPESPQAGRPDFTIAHYLTDTGIWDDYFGPGLENAFGVLWPLVVAAGVAAALLALLAGRDRIVRAAGATAMVGLVAYLFTPLSAAGAEGEPVAFAINVRFVVPALLAALVLLPLPRAFDARRWQWGLLAALVLVLLITDRPDEPARDYARLFALGLVGLGVAAPALIWLGRERGASRGVVLGGAAALILAVVALGYPVQRHYLDERFRNEVAAEAIPGMDLDAAYRWARDVEDARIGLAGTSAGFAGYGFYGADLSNEVVYLGERRAHGAFNAIPTCAAFRRAVNDADLDYLVTAPFLNFLRPSDPIPSPEGRWLRGEAAVAPVVRSGPVTVWRLEGRLDPAACGPANAPLREVPNTPGA